MSREKRRRRKINASCILFQITSSSGSCAIAQQRKSTDFKIDCLEEKNFSDNDTIKTSDENKTHAVCHQLYDNLAINAKSYGLDWMAEQDSNGSLSLSSVDFSPGRETQFAGYKTSNLDFYTDFEYSSFEGANNFTKYAPKQQIFHCL